LGLLNRILLWVATGLSKRLCIKGELSLSALRSGVRHLLNIAGLRPVPPPPDPTPVRRVPRAAPRPDGQPITFDDLSEQLDPSLLPPLDRPDIDESTLTPEQLSWRREGVVELRGFIPEALCDAYIARRAEVGPLGWLDPTPYLRVPELRDLALYPPLMAIMESLLGEPMMLHLNLTGWISTERNWHQDDYLNPGHVNSWYAAVWIALGHIHDGAGPFEYIAGSHHWPLIRQEKVKRWMSPEEAGARAFSGAETWPKTSERFVVPAIEREIVRRGAVVQRFLAEMGDVLIWHGRLLHRGTKATSSEYWRPALIAHYSGINHRPDMPARAQDENGFAYALFDNPL